ncbi:hypothetical protein J4223_04235 [Candidatus Woesearchaeota archaeon]|nr:hypothetical protein [Candidatus Woesearchaeota archaeon]
MLNKKGQSEDVFEYILVSIAIVVGIIVLTMGHNYKEFSVDNAMQTISADSSDIQSFDMSFLGTDLKNILDLQVSDEYTFAELISRMPDNYPDINDKSLFEGLLDQALISNRLSCDEQLFNILNEKLDQVYSDNWIIFVYSDDEMIFFCSSILFDYSKVSSAKITLPSINPNNNVDVVLEVYE